MERSIARRFEDLAPSRAAVVVAVLFIVIALTDKITGRELSFSLFYILPIILVSFRWGTVPGQVAAVIAALAWLSIDLWSGSRYSHPMIPFWNAGVRLGFFSTISWLLDRLHRTSEREAALARTDLLTGLPNRRSFEELAVRELARSARLSSPLALAVVDLDDFKLVNDRQGHSAGDLVLGRFARIAARILRSVDITARMGGDEFAVLLPDVDPKAAVVALHRLREVLLSEGGIQCSMGVAHATGGPLDDVLRRADEALYRAKQSGKGTIELTEMEARFGV